MSDHFALQMDDVHAELLIRVSAAVCMCGQEKRSSRRLFCEDCRERINRVCDRLYLWCFYEFQAERLRRALLLYDMMCDLLHDPKAGLTKQRRHQEEHDGR